MAQIKDLQDRDFVLISDSQDVKYVKAKLGNKAKDFDAFLILVGEGDFAEVYGFNGLIPYMSKEATLLYTTQ